MAHDRNEAPRRPLPHSLTKWLDAKTIDLPDIIGPPLDPLTQDSTDQEYFAYLAALDARLERFQFVLEIIANLPEHPGKAALRRGRKSRRR